MRRVDNFDKLTKYVTKYQMNNIFSKDMKPFMELFLFKRNEHICKESEEIKYIFFLVEGKAKVYTTLSNGKSLLLCFYEGFKILGDVELMGLEGASSNVQVIEDAYCIGISHEKAKRQLLNDIKFLRIICNSLGKKLNQCSKNSSINLLYPLENRLASYILATGKITANGNNKTIEFQETFTEISELLGTSYRHLLRTLNSFTLKGVLKKRNHYFEVIDEGELRKLAADLYK